MRLTWRRVAIAGAVATLALAGWMGRDVPPAPREDVRASDPHPEPEVAGVAVAAAQPASLRTSAPAAFDDIAHLRARLARSSLRGTQVDGALSFDAQGRVQGDRSLRRLFDYFLSLTGEFAPQEITALLLAHVRDAHGDQAALEVAEWFDRYVGLRAELAGAALPEDLAARLDALRAARQRWLGPAAERMFGEEERQIAHTLAQRALAQDPGLSAQEREQALQELDALRPAALQEAEREATAAQLAAEQTRQFDALGADSATRTAERAALWGTEAALRLAALDAERAAWEQRVQDYVQARERIRADVRLDDVARSQALHDLLAGRFAGPERQRIEALESIGALPGG